MWGGCVAQAALPLTVQCGLGGRADTNNLHENWTGMHLMTTRFSDALCFCSRDPQTLDHTAAACPLKKHGNMKLENPNVDPKTSGQGTYETYNYKFKLHKFETSNINRSSKHSNISSTTHLSSAICSTRTITKHTAYKSCCHTWSGHNWLAEL